MIAEARARYERMYRRVGGVPAVPRVIGFLDERKAPLLRDSYDDATGRQLMRAAGGVVTIAGICLYDTDRQAAAQRYLFDALRLAQASADRGFGGYIVALLPPLPAFPGENFCSPAAWADAEYQALRETVTHRWCQRLEAALAEVQAEATEATGQWRLLLIVGWPPVADRDRALAYLAHYPNSREHRPYAR